MARDRRPRDTRARHSELDRPSPSQGQPGTDANYLLTGISGCGECGRPLIGAADHTSELRSGRTRE